MKNKSKPDGLQVTCRKCSKYFSKLWQTRNPEKFRTMMAKFQREIPMEKKVAYHKKWRYANRDKSRIMHSTHALVARAIKDGRLIKPEHCEKCENTNIHGHHDNYLKPLEVQWICALHHKNMKHKYYEKPRGFQYNKQTSNVEL